MRYNDVEIQVLIKGRPITEYPHNGKTYVEGRSGSAFEVKVINHNNFRVEAVISVDGLSVTDGKEAGPSSSGYVINARETISIPGWKLSNEQIAAFEFAGKAKSYDAQSNGGAARNAGVIGLMVFKDANAFTIPLYTTFNTLNQSTLIGQVSPTVQSNGWGGGYVPVGITALNAVSTNSYGDVGALSSGRIGCSLETLSAARGLEGPRGPQGPKGPAGPIGVQAMAVCYNTASVTQATAQTTAKAVAEPVQQNLGTAFGRAQDFATTTVSFQRGDMTAMIVLYYDDLRGLRARGIRIDRVSKKAGSQDPQAFPGMNCAPPPGWRG